MILAAKAATSGQSELSYTWVAAGASGALSTSTSTLADSWTSRTSSFGTSPIYCVAANKTSTWVAVGDAGKLATSSDAITWTQRTSSFSTSIIYTVAFGNGIWVAAGGDGKLATATDPTGTWTQRTTGFAGAAIIIGVNYGNGIWTALATGGEIRTATDPTGTWTLRTSTLSGAPTGGSSRYPVKWLSGQNIFEAGVEGLATTGGQASSPDGITWTARDVPIQTNALPFVSYASSSTVAVMFYRKGSSVDIATSTNGTTWTDRTPATVTNNTNGSLAVDESGLFVAAMTNSIQTSPDGTTWTSRTAPTITDMTIAHSSGG